MFACATTKLGRRFRIYPKVGRVPKASDALLPRSVNILIGHVQCSQSLVDAMQMITMQMPCPGVNILMSSRAAESQRGWSFRRPALSSESVHLERRRREVATTVEYVCWFVHVLQER